MLEYLILGGGLGFAAAIQPGPLQAFLVTRVAATGWKRTLPASFAPLLSDGPIALVALLLLGQLPGFAQHLLQAAGGFLLIYLAWVAFRQWRDPAEALSLTSAPRTLFEAALVNLLNPNPYLGWALVLGPLVLGAWREAPPFALGLLASFYGTMIAVMAGFILLVGTARFLGSRAQLVLVRLSTLLLAGLGIYLLVSSLLSFWTVRG